MRKILKHQENRKKREEGEYFGDTLARQEEEDRTPKAEMAIHDNENLDEEEQKKEEEKESETEATNFAALYEENSTFLREAEAEREKEHDEELERWGEKEVQRRKKKEAKERGAD